MEMKLPRSIETYFHAANSHDSQLIEDCFAEDAVVHDEGEVYHGVAAIKDWNETTSNKYALILVVISVAQEEGETIVTAQASGNFKGSPTSIDFYFTVKNEKISALRCG